MPHQRKLKILIACLALVVLFSHNLIILVAATLGVSIFSFKKIANSKTYIYFLTFIGMSFLPYIIFRDNAYLPLALLFICRSLILYFALLLLAENINLDKLRHNLTLILGKKFTLALTLAFNLLPLVKQLLQKNYGMFYLKSYQSCAKTQQLRCFALSIFRQITNTAESCAENMLLLEHLKQPKIILITGEKHSGKTTFAQDLAAKFKEKNWPIGGIIAPSTFSNNRRATIYVTNMATQEKQLLASREIHLTNVAYEYGGFYFAAEGLEFARRALQQPPAQSIVFLDEYGPLEFANLGFAAEFKQLAKSNVAALFVVIREELVKRFLATHTKLNCEVIKIPQTSQFKIPNEKAAPSFILNS